MCNKYIDLISSFKKNQLLITYLLTLLSLLSQILYVITSQIGIRFLLLIRSLTSLTVFQQGLKSHRSAKHKTGKEKKIKSVPSLYTICKTYLFSCLFELRNHFLGIHSQKEIFNHAPTLKKLKCFVCPEYPATT